MALVSLVIDFTIAGQFTNFWLKIEATKPLSLGIHICPLSDLRTIEVDNFDDPGNLIVDIAPAYIEKFGQPPTQKKMCAFLRLTPISLAGFQTVPSITKIILDPTGVFTTTFPPGAY